MNKRSNIRKIIIAGCGPGGLDHLTPAVRQAIESAEILVGAPRLLESFPAPDAERIAVRADIQEAIEKMAVHVGRRKIVILVTGDPGLCSLAQPVIQRFGRAACQVLPGISSIQVAFARIGLDWLDARIISAHNLIPELDPRSLVDVGKIAVLMGGVSSFRWIAGVARTLGAYRRIFVCENLTLADERVREIKLSDIAALRASSKTVVLLIKKDLAA
ncbi:MAG: precorrin-6y C5,15-methyltransferase (decarboxylating) subunit CbiE [Verrucomicrobia bacterium]|nr:precorrin-6y C5,15-methyltransferase (decarboxylating) subunit CbiE [Verrucomicrobiota bacterium]